MIGFSSIGTLENLILTTLALVVIVIFWGCIYAFVSAIFRFIFSHGEAEKIKGAWNSIRYMIVGILFTLLLLFLFPILFKQLEVQWYQIYTAENIFKKAWELIQGGFGLFNTIKRGSVNSDFYNGGVPTSPSTTNYSL